tara:strand:- start:2366 stop:3457 length:1092 start_codon:yes stop_codon:yes gene_type:complete
MFNRTLKRPMFRRGGSAGGGITSGLAPRQGYNKKGFVEQIRPTKEEYESISGMLPSRSKDSSLNDFLINFGLNMVGNAPTGNIFQTAATQAKDPFARFQQQKATSEASGREESMDILKTIMTAKAEALGSEGGSTQFAKQANAAEIEGYMGELFTLNRNQQNDDTKLSDADYNQKMRTLTKLLQSYTGRNPAVDSLFGNKEQADLIIGGIQTDILDSDVEIEVMGPDGEMIKVIEGDWAAENPSYLGKETSRRYLQQYDAAVQQDIGLPELKAKGGRAGYLGGGGVEEVVEEQVTEEAAPQSSDNLSYQELRSRLPTEITDDIVVILSESPQALIDFSEIQTQTDVDEFNMKYGVNLALPSGA